MGLLVAIPALVAWSYYSKKVENLAVDMEASALYVVGAMLMVAEEALGLTMSEPPFAAAEKLLSLTKVRLCRPSGSSGRSLTMRRSCLGDPSATNTMSGLAFDRPRGRLRGSPAATSAVYAPALAPRTTMAIPNPE